MAPAKSQREPKTSRSVLAVDLPADSTVAPAFLVTASDIDLSRLAIGEVLMLTGRVSGQLGAETVDITYDQGSVEISTHIHSGPTSKPRALTRHEIESLLRALRSLATKGAPGVDEEMTEIFIRLLARTVRTEPSSRFDDARFLDVSRDSSGAIVATIGLGVDVLGTVQDDNKRIGFEQHPVWMSSGTYGSLPLADRASLARALERFLSSNPTSNPLWKKLLDDLGGK